MWACRPNAARRWTLLAGRRDIAAISRMVWLLDQNQRFLLRLPREQGKKTRAAPGYGVFYEILTWLAPEAFPKTPGA